MIETRIDTIPDTGDEWACAYVSGPAGVAEFKVRMRYLDLQQIGAEKLRNLTLCEVRRTLQRMLNAYDPRS